MRFLALLPLVACSTQVTNAKTQTVAPLPVPAVSPIPSNVTPNDGLDLSKFGPLTNGELYLWQTPSARQNAVSASVTLPGVDFHGASFTVRAAPVAYGVDAYMHVYLNGKLWVQIGFNQLNHWLGPLTCALPSPNTDGVFFLGLAANNPTHGNVGDTPEWTNDIPILTPTGANGKYERDTTYSAVYDAGRIRIFVDGREIRYRDEGNPPQVDSDFDNTAAIKPAGSDTVTITLAVLNDGASTSGCTSPVSPFIPGVGPVNAAIVWSKIVVR